MLLLLLIYVQLTKFSDQRAAAAGMLLDLVITKLVAGDRTSFNQLVYALVRTEQLGCAIMLDAELTEVYLQDKGREHG